MFSQPHRTCLYACPGLFGARLCQVAGVGIDRLHKNYHWQNWQAILVLRSLLVCDMHVTGFMSCMTGRLASGGDRLSSGWWCLCCIVGLQDYLSHYKDLLAISVISTVNAAMCDYHVRTCPPSPQLTQVCDEVSSSSSAGNRWPLPASAAADELCSGSGCCKTEPWVCNRATWDAAALIVHEGLPPVFGCAWRRCYCVCASWEEAEERTRTLTNIDAPVCVCWYCCRRSSCTMLLTLR